MVTDKIQPYPTRVYELCPSLALICYVSTQPAGICIKETTSLCKLCRKKKSTSYTVNYISTWKFGLTIFLAPMGETEL